jgi:hypothetical protein
VAFKSLDLCKITNIFGQEVNVLVGRFSLGIHSMRVLGTCIYMQESLSRILLVTYIVTGANDSTGILGANDPAGIYFVSSNREIAPKYQLVATTEVAFVACAATETCKVLPSLFLLELLAVDPACWSLPATPSW